MTTHQCSASGERAATRRPASGRDGGFSFVEVVVTIVLLGVIIVPVMAAVRASVRASTTSRAAAQAETALINAADRINRADLECNYSTYAQNSVILEGWPASNARVHHQWYDRVTNSWTDAGWGVAVHGCPFSTATPELVQLITIEITTPDGQITRSIQVVKSNV